MAKRDFSVGMLISTYNWPQALEVIFQSILQQTQLPDEILIADDGSRADTTQLINRYRKIFKVPVKHAWHEDAGFRKGIILNKAVKLSTSDYIIEIDGDIVLHRRFIEDHIRVAERGYFVQGSRAMVGEAATQEILSGKGARHRVGFFTRGIRNRFNALRLPVLSWLIRANPYGSDNTKACNLAFWREDFIAINGYNNLFFGWGSEDCEFAARLINAGVLKKRLKLAAVCFHLHHEYNSKSQFAVNGQRYSDTKSSKMVFCPDGYAEV
ncbi:glycosyltransferase family 2 protein [Chitinophaga japonensis]|uniref:Glycosyltransferase involved in cell wall biosynthesis n=1 Tax=Chitinophaga japonensis TaxID=104662 RepID=A0A562SMI7_CHIJA|nr:glycosyltransferase family 2 protein [Chitinophaga japonensis]TWI82515.1 glycosyltransferase involved in cell wall biosynthesis [Chitinophaga japonensis]